MGTGNNKSYPSWDREYRKARRDQESDEDKAKRTEYGRAWRAANRERYREYHRKYKARRREQRRSDPAYIAARAEAAARRKAKAAEYQRQWKEKALARPDIPRSLTREYRNAAVRAWFAKPENKAKATERRLKVRAACVQLVRDFKAAHPCVECGEADIDVLDLHHVDPSQKSFGLADASGGRSTVRKVLAELEKVVSMCANCHRRLEKARRRAANPT